MLTLPFLFRNVGQFVCTLLTLLADGLRYLRLCLCPNSALAEENLFLRKQLALYQERHVKPRRTTDTTRLALTCLARWFDWRRPLIIVQPMTLICWHRQGFRMYWRWKSRPGRPPLPQELWTLIRRMACDNPSWDDERLANERLPKLGLRMSLLTVHQYLPKRLNHRWQKRAPSQRWLTFVRNHAKVIMACDFCMVVTAMFRILSVLVVMEHTTRRILFQDIPGLA
jgi:putative transposase